MVRVYLSGTCSCSLRVCSLGYICQRDVAVPYVCVALGKFARDVAVPYVCIACGIFAREM